MRESNTRLSLSHINLSKPVNLLTSALFFHSLHIVYSVFLYYTLSHPSLTSRLKIANRSCYQSALVLRNNLPSRLRQVVHHVTPSPILNCPVSDLSTSLFLKKLKTHLFTLPFLHCMYSPIIAISRLISLVLTKLRLFISHTIRYHSPSYHSHQFFMLFDL